jgi:hypothetical protein
MRAFRISLVLITTIGLGCFSFFEAWSSLQSGVVLLPLSRRVRLTIEFARASEPLAFYATVALYFALGLAFVAGGIWWLRRLASSSYRRQAISEISEVIAGLERPTQPASRTGELLPHRWQPAA